MSGKLSDVMKEVAALSVAEQKTLLAHLSHIQRNDNGTIVTAKPVPGPDKGKGARRRGEHPRAGTMGDIRRFAGAWVGGPGEMERLLDELRRMKEAEVSAKKEPGGTLKAAGMSSGRR